MHKEWMIRWIEGRQTDFLLKGQSPMGKAAKAPILLPQTISSFQNTSIEHLLDFEVCFKCRDTAVSRLPKICPLRIVCIHTYSHTCMHRHIHTCVCTHRHAQGGSNSDPDDDGKRKSSSNPNCDSKEETEQVDPLIVWNEKIQMKLFSWPLSRRM